MDPMQAQINYRIWKQGVITYPMIKPKSCRATIPHFNFDAGCKSHRSLYNSFPKGRNMLEESILQIIRTSSNYEE